MLPDAESSHKSGPEIGAMKTGVRRDVVLFADECEPRLQIAKRYVWPRNSHGLTNVPRDRHDIAIELSAIHEPYSHVVGGLSGTLDYMFLRCHHAVVASALAD